MSLLFDDNGCSSSVGVVGVVLGVVCVEVGVSGEDHRDREDHRDVAESVDVEESVGDGDVCCCCCCC